MTGQRGREDTAHREPLCCDGNNEKRQVRKSEIPPFAMNRVKESKRHERGDGQKGEVPLENLSPEFLSSVDPIKMMFNHSSCPLLLTGATNKRAATCCSTYKLLRLVSAPKDVK